MDDIFHRKLGNYLFGDLISAVFKVEKLIKYMGNYDLITF